MKKLREIYNFLFVPSMENMGMGCLVQMIFWGAIVLIGISFTIGYICSK